MIFGKLLDSIEHKGVLCTLGLHRDYCVDGAWHFSVNRCGHCGRPDAPKMLVILHIERKYWAHVPSSLTTLDQQQWVLERTLNEYNAHAAMR